MKFPGRSALVIALLAANTQTIFLLKTVDPTLSTNFITHLVVTHATVVRIECEVKNSRNMRTHKLILRNTYFSDFAEFFLHDDHSFLLEILYANDVLLTCAIKIALNFTLHKASMS